MEAPRGFAEAKNTIFSVYAGIDGAAIWAAATSSTTAINVQLLACMLARVYGGAETISACFELVKKTKEAIAFAFERGERPPILSVTATLQIGVPRSNVAEWNINARAWLQTADSIKAEEQRQLMSLLDKVDVSVSRDMKVDASVVSA